MNVQEAPPRHQTGTSCPTCGAPAERGQLICLECGSRIALAYRKPPSWRLPAAIIALVALLAGAGAYFGLQALGDDADQEVASHPAPPPEEKAASGDEKQSEEKPAENKQEEEPVQQEEAEPAPQTRDGLAVWPDNEDAYTVVILASQDAASARAFAQNAVEAGVDAGILKADDYPALSASTGFFIVFVGQYPNQAKAAQAAAKLGSNYQGAYPQFVDGSKTKR
jgi:SPOR domain